MISHDNTGNASDIKELSHSSHWVRQVTERTIFQPVMQNINSPDQKESRKKSEVHFDVALVRI